MCNSEAVVELVAAHLLSRGTHSPDQATILLLLDIIVKLCPVIQLGRGSLWGCWLGLFGELRLHPTDYVAKLVRASFTLVRN
jgi:hypothetical protein